MADGVVPALLSSGDWRRLDVYLAGIGDNFYKAVTSTIWELSLSLEEGAVVRYGDSMG